MCEYCNGKTILGRDGEDDEIVIEVSEKYSTISGFKWSFDIDFCPKCGTPLGEVKPLTKEQLEARLNKPVYVVSLTGGYGEWAKFMNGFDGCSYILSGAWKPYGGMDEYGVDWVAYETEPAEKTWRDVDWNNQHD